MSFDYKEVRLMIVTPNFNGGGAQRIAVNLANYYKNKGVNVSLLAFNSKGPYKSQVAEGVELIDICSPRLRNSFLKARKIIKVKEPTHILSVLRGGNIVLGLALFFYRNPKLIFREANTLDDIKRKPWLNRLIELAILRLGYLRANMIIANSEETKKDLVKYGIKISKNIKIISNPVVPIDYEELKIKKVKHEWFNKQNKVILNVGRLHSQKNQKLLIDSFNKVLSQEPNARLLIIGEGELKQYLEEIVRKLNLEGFIQILPFQENPWPFYNNASVFVLTSEWEGFGNVLVEALACGTPVISTDCPGGPRFILDRGKYGMLVASNDNDRLSEALISLLKHPDFFKAEDLIARANEFSVENIGKQYMEAIVNG